MTDPTAVPINMFENDRELMVVAPMPGVAPEDISIDVTDDGRLTLRAAQHGDGQERISYLTREWSYGPYERTIDLPSRRYRVIGSPSIVGCLLISSAPRPSSKAWSRQPRTAWS